MPSKTLVEKRSELDAKRKALKDVFKEAKNEAGETDYARIKSLGENLTDTVKREKIRTMNTELKALADEVEEIASTEQIESDLEQAEKKAGGKRGLKHPDVEDLEEKKDGEVRAGDAFTKSAEWQECLKKDMAPLRSADGRVKVPAKDLFGYRKAITTVGIGSSTTGVQQQQRLEGITELARRALRIRDLMRVRLLGTGNSYDWVRQTTRTNLVSPQVEGVRKAESTYAWESQSDTIKTIAHFTKVSRQALDDIPWLRSQIDDELMYGLLVKEEEEILFGDGTGQHLDGLATQATAYDSGTYNVSGDTRLDIIRHAKLQARLAGLATFAPDAVILHPEDLHDIELIKTEEGAANKGVYVVGDPRTGEQMTRIWGLNVVESDAMSSGQFLVGAFGTAAEIVDRMQAMIQIAFQNEADFVENLATILAEERIGLAVRRPDAFIVGTF